MSEDWGKCDTCGKPATSLARDVLRHEAPLEFVAFSPTGIIRHGCDEHPAESREYRTELPPPVRP